MDLKPREVTAPHDRPTPSKIAQEGLHKAAPPAFMRAHLSLIGLTCHNIMPQGWGGVFFFEFVETEQPRDDTLGKGADCGILGLGNGNPAAVLGDR